eukprot:9445520-Alexandrium_andersonii.AAC.1
MSNLVQPWIGVRKACFRRRMAAVGASRRRHLTQRTERHRAPRTRASRMEFEATCGIWLQGRAGNRSGGRAASYLGRD